MALSPSPENKDHSAWPVFGVAVQLLSRVQLFVTPWTAVCQASLFVTASQSLLKFMSIVWMMPSNHLILCRPLLLLPSIFPNIRVFSNELALRIRWPKYWSFSFSISSSNVYSGLISFRIDWFDLAGKGSLKNLLQHHNSKVSILRCSTWYHLSYQGASLVAQTVKNLTTIQETQVEALGWEDPLEKGMVTHCSILA